MENYLFLFLGFSAIGLAFPFYVYWSWRLLCVVIFEWGFIKYFDLLYLNIYIYLLFLLLDGFMKFGAQIHTLTHLTLFCTHYYYFPKRYFLDEKLILATLLPHFLQFGIYTYVDRPIFCIKITND